MSNEPGGRRRWRRECGGRVPECRHGDGGPDASEDRTTPTKKTKPRGGGGRRRGTRWNARRGRGAQGRQEAKRPRRWGKGFRHWLVVSSASPGETGGREPGAPDGHQGTEPTAGHSPGQVDGKNVRKQGEGGKSSLGRDGARSSSPRPEGPPHAPVPSLRYAARPRPRSGDARRLPEVFHQSGAKCLPKG